MTMVWVEWYNLGLRSLLALNPHISPLTSSGQRLMGVPNSEVGYTAAMPRREDHEVHVDKWWHWTKKDYKYTFSLAYVNTLPKEK